MLVTLLVVAEAERHGKLVRDLAPKCRRLGELQLMCVRVVTAADEAGFGRDEGEVARVSDPACLGECQFRLVEALLAMGVHSLRLVEGNADDFGQCLIDVGNSLEGVEEGRHQSRGRLQLAATKFDVSAILTNKNFVHYGIVWIYY